MVTDAHVQTEQIPYKLFSGRSSAPCVDDVTAPSFRAETGKEAA